MTDHVVNGATCVCDYHWTTAHKVSSFYLPPVSSYHLRAASSQRQLTVDAEDVRLDDIFVALGMTGVIAGVDQLDVVDIEGAVGKDLEFVLGQLGQIESVASPDDWRIGRTGHVAFDFDVVADAGREVIHFQSLVQ